MARALAGQLPLASAGLPAFTLPCRFYVSKNRERYTRLRVITWKAASTFAVDGGDCKVNKDVERVLKEFHQAGKPIGYVRPSGPGGGGAGAVAEPVAEAVAHSQEMAPGAVCTIPDPCRSQLPFFGDWILRWPHPGPTLTGPATAHSPARGPQPGRRVRPVVTHTRSRLRTSDGDPVVRPACQAALPTSVLGEGSSVLLCRGRRRTTPVLERVGRTLWSRPWPGKSSQEHSAAQMR
ncbi:hypothetical protein J1605_003625 [Eschrichtius robustus]|uniref:Uncharacterized protein n=1 Tax=Eschrichtius robustus TaxID=9764 RepID=A0AB34HPY5_ESCRO|nr:hypothetical protein J1605_003625 [Eschrichtius robustus]